MKQFLLLLVVGLLVAGTGIVAGLPDPPTPGVGNIPTYSGNGNGDELFKLCYGTINGVRSI